MLRRLALALRFRYVRHDVRRLIHSHGSHAIFVARHAAAAAREPGRDCHWRRVLAGIERRSTYRAW